ncbi:cyclase family protein [Candidatus Chloroploca sp. Khr17]|uniref:cyclase family protein n=1 Tax=Candidatus Chloroploca sp. Khr17 TaxID=2496869 RepID=UPI00101CE1CF|nr:cyclase family protein [Candidatus Chloroploca sp. Khr17]
MKILHDLSMLINATMPVYAGDAPVCLEPHCTIAADGVNITAIKNATTHFGTHIDLPRHIFADGASLDEVPLADLCGPAQIIAIEHPTAITVEEVACHRFKPGEMVLFRTRNTRDGLLAQPAFHHDYVYLTPEAASYLVEQAVRLVGIDYLSVDPPYTPSLPAHHILLGHGVLILEGIILTDVQPGKATLLCLPLKLQGVDGAPVRAVLVEG